MKFEYRIYFIEMKKNFKIRHYSTYHIKILETYCNKYLLCLIAQILLLENMNYLYDSFYY